MRGKHWTLENHLCRTCGGRILRCASGAGPSGGGNPLFQCSLCEKQMSGTGTECLCYCGIPDPTGRYPYLFICVHPDEWNDPTMHYTQAMLDTITQTWGDPNPQTVIRIIPYAIFMENVEYYQRLREKS